MVLPPMVAMIFAEHYLLTHIGKASYLLTWADPGYVPMLFLGIYCFILLVGPGKISVDYFLSLHFIHIENHNEEDELEEV
jgi:putative oxidoreductase